MQLGAGDFWTAHLQPTDTPPLGGPGTDVDVAVKAALAGRSDLARARVDVANAETAIKYYDNQKLPDIRLELSHRSAGLGGTQFVRQGAFPGTIVGTQNVSYSDVLDQIFSRNYPAWTAGVTVSVPLGHSYEDASLARAKVQQQQAKSRLESLEIRAVRDIRQAAWQVDTTAQRVDTTRVGRELAEQRLDAEQKRYEVGMSTSFLVVQAQRDLTQARVNELTAMLDHQVALVDFESLQQAPSANAGSVSVSGTQIVSLPPPTPRGMSAPNGNSLF